MANNYIITLTTTGSISGSTAFVPKTLPDQPVLVHKTLGTKYFGDSLGNGGYTFSDLTEGLYDLYDKDGGSKITNWGGTNGKWIGTDAMTKYARVATANTFTATQTFSGSIIVSESAQLPANTTIGNVTSTEIGYLDGITSAIQTQLNNRLTLDGDNVLTGTLELTNSTTGSLVVSGGLTINGEFILSGQSSEVATIDSGHSTLNHIGSVDNSAYLAEPAFWLRVKINNQTYIIPCYSL